MAPIKVTYFNLTALGEPIRFILKYADIEFEDIRVGEDEWPKFKPTVPFGQLPIIEKDGKIVNQSVAICRYLAKQCELNGKDDWEDLEIDATVDNITDMRTKIGPYVMEKDPEIKKSTAPLVKEILSHFLSRFDERAKKSNGYLALDRLTWADIYFVAVVPYISYRVEQDIIAEYPNLKAVNDNVLSIPAIKKWVETRPKSVV